MERSPTKWKTMYRDQFRKFTESPDRNAFEGEAMEGEGQDPMVDNFVQDA